MIYIIMEWFSFLHLNKKDMSLSYWFKEDTLENLNSIMLANNLTLFIFQSMALILNKFKLSFNT